MMNSIHVFLLVWTLLGTSCLARGVRAESVLQLRKDSRSDTYVAPSSKQIRASEALFRAILEGELNPARLEALSRESGLRVLWLEDGDQELLAVAEPPGKKRGWGVFAFRKTPSTGLVAQAPHSYFDTHTGVLTQQLLLEGFVDAAAWNTTARGAPVETSQPTPHGTASADLAHLEEGFFQAFARAFARACPQGVLLQLHGFAREKRASKVGAASDVIVSNGRRPASAWLVRTDRLLTTALPLRVSAFPHEIDELGGTRNAQKMALEALGHGGFLHVEMSLAVRERLRRDGAFRRSFWNCFPSRQER